MTTSGFGGGAQAAQSGVIVTATSTNNLQEAGTGAAAAASVAVSVVNNLPGLDDVARGTTGPLYGVDATSGGLVAVDPTSGVTSQFFSNGHDGVTGLTGAHSVAISADGTRLFGGTTTGSVLSFTRDPASGALSPISAPRTPDRAIALRSQGSGPEVAAVVSGSAGSVLLTSGLSAAVGPAATAASADGSVWVGAAGAAVPLTQSDSGLAVAATVTLPGTPTALATGAGGHVVYAVDGNAGRLYVIDGTSDRVVQTLRGGVAGVTGLAGGISVTVTLSGGTDQYVLVSDSGRNSVAVFAMGKNGLQFVQIARNGMTGETGLARPDRILVSGATGQVGTGLGGFSTISVAANLPPPPAPLLTAFSGIGTVTLSTGSGDDHVNIKSAPGADVTALDVMTNAGNDSVTVGALAANTVVDLGGWRRPGRDHRRHG